jgi:hypothetical protein
MAPSETGRFRLGRTAAAVGRFATGALGACAAFASLGVAPAAAHTVASRDTYVDAAAPSANFDRARFLRVDGSPVRRALLRFPVSPAGVKHLTLRLYATGSSRESVAVRASPCTWNSRTVTSRTLPRAGRVLSARADIAAGWNAFTLPADAVRAHVTTCLQLTKEGRGLVRFRAHGGARAPQLVARRAGAASASKAANATAPAPSAKPRPGSPVPGTTPVAIPRRLPPSATGYCAATGAAWAGAGRTIAVRPGESLQAAVNGAAPGDTIELADGTYARATVTLSKAVRLRAQHPFGAVLVGNATPTTANDASVGTPTPTAISIRADGAMVEGLEIRYYGIAIAVDDSSNVVVQGNRIVSSYDDGVQLWDTRDTEVRCNELLDPYLADDPVASLTTQAISDAQMDYGVSVYGSIAPRVQHNYFQGIFNQALSFKEGNLDAYAGYNTFEGFNLTALFLGQNIPHNGPYAYNGLPTGPDRGTLVVEYNVFRNAYGVRGGTKVVYFARSPIRVWHVDATTILRGNVVESSQQGFLLECRSGASAGCATGTIRLEGNTVGGRVRGLSGALTTVNTTAGVLVYTGLKAPVTVVDNLFSMLPTSVKTYSDGVSGPPSVTETGNVVASSSSAAPDLREARATTDPDLSFAAGA